MQKRLLAFTAAFAITGQSVFAAPVVKETRNLSSGYEKTAWTIKGNKMNDVESITTENADGVEFGDEVEIINRNKKTIRANHIEVDKTRGIIYVLNDKDGGETKIPALVINQPTVLDGGVPTNGDDGQESENDVALVGENNSSDVTAAGNNTFTGNNTFQTGTLALAGATTISGNTTITGVLQGGTPLVFEGTTSNDFETTIAAENPTVDATVTIPNRTGTVDLIATTAGALALTAATTYAVNGFGKLINVSHDTNPRTITTLTGGVVGQIIILKAANADGVNTITITDTDANTANTINLTGAATNLVLNAVGEDVILMFDGTRWNEIGRGI